MSTVVTTPTGNIGRVLTDQLLQAGEEVTLLARHPEKVADFVKRGAKVEQGSLDDADFVTAATRGARKLFWLNPPNFATEDMIGMYTGFGRAAAAAIEANGIERVVHLSSFGAQSSTGGGPVNALYHVERILNDAAENIAHLRAGYFMENFFGSIPTIAQAGALYMPIPGKTKTPMVATRDIAAVAAKWIRDDTWSGVQHVGVHGAADVSFDEVAATLGEVLGKPVQHVEVPPEAVLEAMAGMGISAHFAELMVELMVGLGKGTFRAVEPRTAETTTPTTLRAFVEDTLAPAVRQATRSAEGQA